MSRRARSPPDGPGQSSDVTLHEGIPLTNVVLTLIDLACGLDPAQLERAVNEADRLDLIDPSTLRAALDAYAGRPGVARLRELLDRRTFRLTDSDLERLFLPLVAQAGMPLPLTRQRLNGFRVDFFWPDLRLVVETDGLRYHRTPAQQARDQVRDQAHLAAGFTPLRFTHAQVRYEAEHVRSTLQAVARRLESGGPHLKAGDRGTDRRSRLPSRDLYPAVPIAHTPLMRRGSMIVMCSRSLTSSPAAARPIADVFAIALSVGLFALVYWAIDLIDRI